jgi:prefoldin subunit 5
MTEDEAQGQDKHRDASEEADKASFKESDAVSDPVASGVDNFGSGAKAGLTDGTDKAPVGENAIVMADIEFVLRQELRPLIAELSGEVDRSKALMKRLGLAAAGTIALAGILLFVASGRLAGEVGNVESATLAILKRIVNMNSALESFSNIESNIRLVDQGQADILAKLSTLSQELVHSDERAADRLTLIGDQISLTAQDDTQFDDLEVQLSALEAQLSGVQAKINSMSQALGDLEPLKESISILVDIERQNLTELFAQKIALEEAQLQKTTKDEPEPKYDPEIILLNPR